MDITKTVKFFPELESFLQKLTSKALDHDRRQQLDVVVAQLCAEQERRGVIRLNFICTHNSRRSHLAQVWAQTMAAHFELKGVHCYSGGTESTALFPVVAETLATQGFQVERISQGSNPVYAMKYGPDSAPIIGFSKPWDHTFNPQSDFIAVMVCSQAANDCPYIAGASKRLALTYEDPKLFDESPLQAVKYEERSTQIAQEMHYLFGQLKRSHD